MAGAQRKEFYQKLIKQEGEVYYAKRNDYIAKWNKKKNSWLIYRREMEGFPWQKIYEIPYAFVDDQSKWKKVPGAFGNYRIEGNRGYYVKEVDG